MPRDPHTQENEQLMHPEFHRNALRPCKGSLVNRFPGWDVLMRLQDARCADAKMHEMESWKHGIMGAELPGMLVVKAQR